MEEYFTGDPLGRKHYLNLAPVIRHGQHVAFSVEVSRLEADATYTQLHYFIPALQEQWLSEEQALFFARIVLKNHYATAPVLP